MKTPFGSILFAGALVLAWCFPPAAGAGEVVVIRQKDGTLLITNTGTTPDGTPIPELRESATVREVQPPAAVREDEAGPAPAGGDQAPGTGGQSAAPGQPGTQQDDGPPGTQGG